MEDNSIVRVPMDKGQFAVVSASQYHLVENISWSSKWVPKSRTYYADGNIKDTRPGREGRWRGVRMHRILCGILARPDLVVHHRDGNGLNNTVENMQVMTVTEHNKIPKERHAFRWIPTHLEGTGYTHPPKRLRSIKPKVVHIENLIYPESGVRFPTRTHGEIINGKLHKPCSGQVCPQCGGKKGYQSAYCFPCRKKARKGIGNATTRPPVDENTYLDAEGRPYRKLAGTKFQYALVSARRYEEVSKHLWRAQFISNTGKYCFTTLIDGVPTYLHRFLLGNPEGKVVDHRNRNPLDCRDYNLRVASHTESACNRGVRGDNTVGFKGVASYGKTGWVGRVTYEGRLYQSPRCATKEEAARAYNELAMRLYGEFACLNEIPCLEVAHPTITK